MYAETTQQVRSPAPTAMLATNRRGAIQNVVDRAKKALSRAGNGQRIMYLYSFDLSLTEYWHQRLTDNDHQPTPVRQDPAMWLRSTSDSNARTPKRPSASSEFEHHLPVPAQHRQAKARMRRRCSRFIDGCRTTRLTAPMPPNVLALRPAATSCCRTTRGAGREERGAVLLLHRAASNQFGVAVVDGRCCCTPGFKWP